jgi:hypothetical protein
MELPEPKVLNQRQTDLAPLAKDVLIYHGLLVRTGLNASWTNENSVAALDCILCARRVKCLDEISPCEAVRGRPRVIQTFPTTQVVC